MNKKNFIWSIEKIIETEDMFKPLADAIHVLDPDSYRPVISGHTSLALDILEKAVDDKYDWISYWFYELEQGKKYKPGCVTEKNGKNIKMKTPGDLYECIINKK